MQASYSRPPSWHWTLQSAVQRSPRTLRQKWHTVRQRSLSAPAILRLSEPSDSTSSDCRTCRSVKTSPRATPSTVVMLSTIYAVTTRHTSTIHSETTEFAVSNFTNYNTSIAIGNLRPCACSPRGPEGCDFLFVAVKGQVSAGRGGLRARI